GKYVVRDWMDIAMDVLVLIVRLIAPVRALHNFKVVDLGHHSKRLSGATMGLWGAVLTLNLVQASRDLATEEDSEVIFKRTWDGIQAFVDLAALPFDFGFGAGHPVLAITGAALNIASAGSLLVKDALYYE
ncbi:hypothetical protein ACFLR2_02140, partial [Chlamydiota bacterium]